MFDGWVVKKLNWLALGKVAVLSVLLTACAEDQQEETKTLVDVYQEDPIALERGRMLFQGSCADYCHGTDPEPGEDVDLFDCQWQHGGSNEEIFRIVTSGIPETRMVGFGNNFPEGQNDLWKIIAFLRSEQASCN